MIMLNGFNHIYLPCSVFQLGVSLRSIRRWLKTYDEEMEVRASERGRHSKTSSPIVDPAFREKFCDFVKSELRKPGAKNFVSTSYQQQIIKILCIVLRTSSTDYDKTGHLG